MKRQRDWSAAKDDLPATTLAREIDQSSICEVGSRQVVLGYICLSSSHVRFIRPANHWSLIQVLPTTMQWCQLQAFSIMMPILDIRLAVTSFPRGQPALDLRPCLVEESIPYQANLLLSCVILYIKLYSLCDLHIQHWVLRPEISKLSFEEGHRAPARRLVHLRGNLIRLGGTDRLPGSIL